MNTIFLGGTIEISRKPYFNSVMLFNFNMDGKILFVSHTSGSLFVSHTSLFIHTFSHYFVVFVKDHTLRNIKKPVETNNLDQKFSVYCSFFVAFSSISEFFHMNFCTMNSQYMAAKSREKFKFRIIYRCFNYSHKLFSNIFTL